VCAHFVLRCIIAFDHAMMQQYHANAHFMRVSAWRLPLACIATDTPRADARNTARATNPP